MKQFSIQLVDGGKVGYVEYPCTRCRKGDADPHRVPEECAIKPNPSQLKFHHTDITDDDVDMANAESKNKVRLIKIFDGAFGGGKTIAALNELIGCAVLNGGRWLVCAPTEKLLYESDREMFLEIVPQEMIVGEALKEKICLRTHDGGIAEILFWTYDATGSGQQFKNLVLAGALMDQAEQAKEEHLGFLAARLRYEGIHPSVYRVLLVSNSGNAGWIERTFFGPDRKAGWHGVKVASKENERNLPEGYIESLRSMYSKQWQDRYLDSKPDTKVGAVYPQLADKTHLHEPVQMMSQWTKIIAVDPGYRNPCAAIFAYVHPDGYIQVYDEHYLAGALISMNVAKILSKMEGHKIKGDSWLSMGRTIKAKDVVWVFDPAVKKGNPINGQSEADEWMRLGIRPIHYANNSMMYGIDTVSKYLEEVASDGKPKLRISPDCEMLIRQMKDYRWPEPKVGVDPKDSENPVKQNDHTCDALRYICVWVKEHYMGIASKGRPEERAWEQERNRVSARVRNWAYRSET